MFGVWSFGFLFPGSVSGVWVSVFGSEVSGFEVEVSVGVPGGGAWQSKGFGFWISVSGYWVSGLGFGVSVSGLRVSVLGVWVGGVGERTGWWCFSARSSETRFEFRGLDFGFLFPAFGFRVSGIGFRVSSVGVRTGWWCFSARSRASPSPIRLTASPDGVTGVPCS